MFKAVLYSVSWVRKLVNRLYHWFCAAVHSLKPRSCVKVEVAVLGSPSLMVLTVSVDVKQLELRAQELCESGGGRP